MVTEMIPFETVFIELIAPTGNVHEITGSRKDFASFLVIKLAVAHVSNNARHLIKLKSLSCTYIVAVVIN